MKSCFFHQKNSSNSFGLYLNKIPKLLSSVKQTFTKEVKGVRHQWFPMRLYEVGVQRVKKQQIIHDSIMDFHDNEITYDNLGRLHFVITAWSLQIRSFFWSEYRKIRTRKNSVFLTLYTLRNTTCRASPIIPALRQIQQFLEQDTYYRSLFKIEFKNGDNLSQQLQVDIWRGTRL